MSLPHDSHLYLRLAFCLYLLACLLYLVAWRRDNKRALLGAQCLVSFGFICQTISLGLRCWQAGYLPVTNLFSTLFFFSWALAATYLYYEFRYRLHASGLFVMLLNLLLLAGTLTRPDHLRPLIPALDTPLFTWHVAFSFLGYAQFAMAFSLAVLFLLQERINSQRLPVLLSLRKYNEEAIFLGFVFFSLCMLIGSLWAYRAWGYYFSWNIKGVWSFVVWLFYAGMCHAKFVRRWQGRGYAILSIAGFGIVLFTYLGIGLLLSSNHPLS